MLLRIIWSRYAFHLEKISIRLQLVNPLRVPPGVDWCNVAMEIPANLIRREHKRWDATDDNQSGALLQGKRHLFVEPLVNATVYYGLITLAYSGTGTGTRTWTSTIGNNGVPVPVQCEMFCIISYNPFFLVPVPVCRRQIVWIDH